MPSSVASALALLALLTTPAIAHSWVEQLTVINPSGSFTGQPGYARNNTLRTAPGFTDLLMVHILPGQGQPSLEQRDAPPSNDVQNVQPTDPMCKKTQQAQFQSADSPRLKAAPGDMVALRYEENGHVTLPANQPGKPANRGNVYIYGTTQPKSDDTLLNIFGVWNADGSGGDKRGKLLATQPFDDGQCYQVNGGTISASRQKEHPHPASQVGGTDLWCQNDIKIPADAPSGKPYTLYWVWDWPTLPKVDPGLPNGKAEIYTTCMDVDITGTKATRDLEDRQAPASGSGSGISNSAIPAYVKQLNAAPAASAPASPSNLAVAPVASSPAAAPVASSPAAAPAASSPAAAPVVSSPAAAPVAASPAAAAPVASSPAAAPVAAPVAASAPAAPAPAAPVAPSVVTVTVTASAAAQAPAQPTTMATMVSPAAANPAPTPASQAAAAPPANSMPPSSLQIAPPIL